MPVDMSSLSEVLDGAVGWKPLTPVDFAVDCFISCFDQSFSATGYTEIIIEDGTISVGRTETIKPPPGTEKLTGFEHDFACAAHVEERAYDLIASTPHAGLNIIVHETPAVTGARGQRTATKINPIPSRMAGQAIRSAVRRIEAVYTVILPPVQMVQAQKAKKVICGNHRADKKEAHAGLRQLTWLNGLDRLTNEALRDAAMLGLVVGAEVQSG